MKYFSTTVLFIICLVIAFPVFSIDKLELLQMGLAHSKDYNVQNSDRSKNPGGPNWGTDDITWMPLPLATGAFRRCAIGRIDNYIYIFGGMGGAGSSTAMAFNIVTEQWEASTIPFVTGYNWNGVVANGELYVFPKSFGGGEVQKFTPLGGGPTGTWSLAAIYPVNTNAFAVGWDGGNYIYCAGSSSSPYGTPAYKLEISTATFSPIAPLPQGRGWVGGGFLNGKFYVVGGSNSSYQATNTCFEYDPATNTWATKAAMPEAVSFTCFCATNNDNLLFVVGGGGGYTGNPGTSTVQVYDPATDTWILETPRMTDYGCNSAIFVQGDNYIFEGGGWDGVNGQALCWKGILQVEIPVISVTLTPLALPPINPMQFNIALVNNDSIAWTFDVWTMTTLPDGSPYGPLIGPLNLTFAPGFSADRDRQQNIPAHAPAGDYTYDAYVGEYPDDIWDEDHFEFTKLAVSDGEPIVPEWNNWGESFGTPTGEVSGVNPGEFILLSAYPNPFNPSTNIMFNLKNPENIELAVFDITGREVAKLVEGWQQAGVHEINFDASRLPSGIYFARLRAGRFQGMQKLLLIK